MGTVLSLRGLPKTQNQPRRLIPLFSVCSELFRTGVLHSCKVWFVTSAQRTGGAGLLISIKVYIHRKLALKKTALDYII